MSPVARPNPVSNCPLTAAWAAVGGKWKLTIIYWLAERPRHFAGLRRQLDSVSEGMRADQPEGSSHSLNCLTAVVPSRAALAAPELK